MPDLDPNEEVVTEETEETPVSEIPYPEGTAPPVHDPLTANAPQFTLTEAVIQSAGDISEETIAEMRKGTAKEALEILHDATYLGLADAFKNGLSAGGGGGSSEQPMISSVKVRGSDSASTLEYVEGSYVEGLIQDIVAVTFIDEEYTTVVATIKGGDRDGNRYAIAPVKTLDVEDQQYQTRPVSAGVCIMYYYYYDEETDTEGQRFVGVCTGYFTATVTTKSNVSTTVGGSHFGVSVKLSDGAFVCDNGETLGFIVDNYAWNPRYTANRYVIGYGVVPNNDESAVEDIGIATMTYDTFDGAEFVDIVYNGTSQVHTIYANTRIGYLVGAYPLSTYFASNGGGRLRRLS